MTHFIDPNHFRELARLHPEDVCRRELCRYDHTKKSYILNEFPPESKLLFDRSIHAHLTLDIIFALAVNVCARIGHK